MAHLVFQTAFPGDLLLSIPLIKRIREWDPGAQLILACRPGLGDFFKEFGLVDDFVSVDKKSEDKGAAALKRLQAESWDTIFVPHQSVRTAWWMARLRAREKVGFAKWWNRLVYSKRVQRPLHLPDALRQLSLMTAVDSGFAETYADPQVQWLRNPDTQISPLNLAEPLIPAWASMQVLEHKPKRNVVFLAPGSVWATKRWTAKGYEELARLLLARGFEVELVGSPSERALCEQIAGAVDGKVVNRAGQTSFTGLVHALNEGQVLVTNDSGAMHAGAVAGIPIVSIFGPTTLNIGYRPWSNKAIVIQRELKCRPCGKHGHHRCPLGTHECMESISAANVLLAVLSKVPGTF